MSLVYALNPIQAWANGTGSVVIDPITPGDFSSWLASFFGVNPATGQPNAPSAIDPDLLDLLRSFGVDVVTEEGQSALSPGWSIQFLSSAPYPGQDGQWDPDTGVFTPGISLILSGQSLQYSVEFAFVGLPPFTANEIFNISVEVPIDRNGLYSSVLDQEALAAHLRQQDPTLSDVQIQAVLDQFVAGLADGKIMVSSLDAFNLLRAYQTDLVALGYSVVLVSDIDVGNTQFTFAVDLNGYQLFSEAAILFEDDADSSDSTSLLGGKLSVDGLLALTDSQTVTGSSFNGNLAAIGSLIIAGNGQWTYTVDNNSAAVQSLGAGQSIVETFTVQISDGSTRTVSFTINGVNDPASISGTASGSVTEDATLTTGGQLTVTDVDTGQKIFAPPSGLTGSYGTWTFDVMSGAWAYTLNNNNALVQALPSGGKLYDTLTVKSLDGTATQLITVTINGTNDGPTAVADTGTTSENSSLIVSALNGLLSNDSDPDVGDVLTVSAVGGASGNVGQATAGSNGGTFTIAADGSYVFDPGSAFNYLSAGQTATTSIGYTISDGKGGTSTATVTITVTGTNDGPTAVADTGTTSENSSLIVSALNGLLSNDSDPDVGDVLTVSAVGGASGNVGQATAGSNGGTFTIAADGSYVFDPGSAFNYLSAGQTATTSIGYTISDGKGGTSTATVTITVTGTNDGPTAVADTGTTSENSSLIVSALNGLLSNDSDPDVGDVLTVTAVGGASGNVGQATAGSNGGTFTIAADGSYVFDPGSAFNYLSAGQTATTSIGYTISDGKGGTSTATVTITVTGTNDGPTAVADTGTTSENSSLIVSALNGLLSNDSDPDVGDVLTVTAVGGASGNVGQATAGSNGGTFTIAADGSYVFDPGSAFNYLSAGQTATTSIGYTISDGKGGTSTATVTITVTGTNDGPTAVADTGTTSENSSLIVSALNGLLSNDSDPDVGDVLTVTAVGGASGNVGQATAGSNGGTFTIAADGSYVFDPGSAFNYLSAGQTATTSIGYTISDGKGGTSTATVTITVTGTNDGPTAVADTGTTSENSSLIVSALNGLLSNDSDPDVGDVLTVTAVGGASGNVGQATAGSNGGTFTIAADGSYVFDPGSAFNYLSAGQTATTSIGYTISDGKGGTSTATVTITVTGTNDGPTAVADTGTTSENSSLIVSALNGLLSNDSDPDVGDVLTVSAVGGASGNVGQATAGSNGGTFTIAADGSYVFDPGSAFNYLSAGQTATTSIGYTISDGKGGTSTATVTITVTGSSDFIASPGSTTLFYQEETGNYNYSADSGVTLIELKRDGKPFTAATSGDGFQLLTAGVIEVSPGVFQNQLLWKNVGTNQVFTWIMDSNWNYVSDGPATTIGSNTFAIESQFNYDIDKNDLIGTEVAVQPAGLSVTTKVYAGTATGNYYYSGNGGVTLIELKRDGKPFTAATSGDGFQLLTAGVIEVSPGVFQNQLLWKNVGTNQVFTWIMDSNWNYVSDGPATTIGSNTFAIESQFNYDIDKNDLIGTEVAVQPAGLSVTTKVYAGTATGNYYYSGNGGVTLIELKRDGKPFTAATSGDGFQLLTAGVIEVSPGVFQNQLLWKNVGTNQVFTWIMDSNWNYVSDGPATTIGSNTFAIESQFNYDIDKNDLIGTEVAVQPAGLSVTTKVYAGTATGNYYYSGNGGVTLIELKRDGKPFTAATSGDGFQPLTAGVIEVSPGVFQNQLLWKNVGTNQVFTWIMDSNWNYVSDGPATTIGSNTFAIESQFNYDIDKNDLIGTEVAVQPAGLSVTTKVYAGTATGNYYYSGNGGVTLIELKRDGKPFTAATSGDGFQLLTAGVIEVSPGVFQNQLLWKNVGTNQVFTWIMDSNWNYVSDGPATTIGSNTFAIESQFNYDIDKNDLIGTEVAVQPAGLSVTTKVYAGTATGNYYYSGNGGVTLIELKRDGKPFTAATSGDGFQLLTAGVIEVSPGVFQNQLLWKNVGTNQVFTWIMDSNWNYVSDGPATTIGSNTFAIESQFNYDIDKNDLIGTEVAVQPAGLSVTTKVYAGTATGNYYYSGNGGVTLIELKRDGKPFTAATSGDGFQPLTAGVIEVSPGVFQNQLLWKNVGTNQVFTWIMDSNWNYVSDGPATTIGSNTFAIESQFNYDIDKNDLIGTEVAVQPAGLSVTTKVYAGTATGNYYYSGNGGVTLIELKRDGKPFTAATSGDGFQLLTAGVIEVSPGVFQNQLLWKNVGTNQVFTWIMDSNWNYVSDGPATTIGSNTFAIESQFNYDIDKNDLIGTEVAVQPAGLSVTTKVYAGTATGNYYYSGNGGVTLIELKRDGKPFTAATSGDGFQLLTAGVIEVSPGVFQNQLLWKNVGTNQVFTWIMDSNWNYVSDGPATTIGGNSQFLETSFDYDIDGINGIGDPLPDSVNRSTVLIAASPAEGSPNSDYFIPLRSQTPQVVEVTGLGGQDAYQLYDSNGVLFAAANVLDYLRVSDFGSDDLVALKGAVTDYSVSAVTIDSVAGYGIYYQSDLIAFVAGAVNPESYLVYRP